MATVAVAYTGPTSITISPASLASSSTFLAGRESSQIDNTSDLFVDALVQGLVTVGTTPTVGVVNVYVWGSHTSLGTTALDVLDGTDSAETITNAGVLASMLRLAGSAYVTATTSDVAYPIATFSVAALFGGSMPRYWGIFLAHNTVAALNATGGNHVWNYTGVKYTVA